MHPFSRIEVSREALEHNIVSLKKTCAQKSVIAVIKANAYGHGVREVVPTLEPFIDFFQVDDISEAEIVRPLTLKPIFVLGSIPSWDWGRIFDLGIQPALYRVDMLEWLANEAMKRETIVPVHVKVDALLGRQGLLPNDALLFLDKVVACEYVRLAGIYMHFSDVEDTTDTKHALDQWEAFLPVAQKAKALFSHVLIHASATGAVFVHDAKWPTNAVRFGIGLYGLWPSLAIQEAFGTSCALKPVARWVSYVAQIKEVPAGFPIGYGRTFIADKPMRIAVIPQGYSDGYDRGLSNRGVVLIRGARCSILGRIAMNMCVADVSQVPNVRVEDEVILLGQQGNECVSAEEIAELSESINYEVVARLSPLLPRVVV